MRHQESYSPYHETATLSPADHWGLVKAAAVIALVVIAGAMGYALGFDEGEKTERARAVEAGAATWLEDAGTGKKVFRYQSADANAQSGR